MLKLYRVVITIKSSVKNLEDKEWLMNLCREIAKISGFNILSEGFSRFEKQGATAFLVLSQSHLSIHTWPEYEIAYIDILSNKEISNKELKKIEAYLNVKVVVKFVKTETEEL